MEFPHCYGKAVLSLLTVSFTISRMDIFTKYLYFWGSLVALAVFAVIFCLRKDLHRRMVKIGFVVGIAGVLSEAVFFRDYWHPPLLIHFGRFGGVEDFLCGFAMGGIATSLYDTIFHKRLRRKGYPHIWIVPVIVASEMLSILILFYGFGLNSIYASAIGFIVPAIVIAIVRKDLIVEILFSAVLFGALLSFTEMLALIFAPTYLKLYFVLYGKAPLIFGVVPLTEFLWGASFAAIVSPLFDFDYGFVPVGFAAAWRKRARRRI